MSPSPRNRSSGRQKRGDIGSQYTATSEGHHWGLESEKNTCHYPFHMEFMQASGLQSRATRSRVSRDKNNSADMIITLSSHMINRLICAHIYSSYHPARHANRRSLCAFFPRRGFAADANRLYLCRAMLGAPCTSVQTVPVHPHKLERVQVCWSEFIPEMMVNPILRTWACQSPTFNASLPNQGRTWYSGGALRIDPSSGTIRPGANT